MAARLDCEQNAKDLKVTWLWHLSPWLSKRSSLSFFQWAFSSHTKANVNSGSQVCGTKACSFGTANVSDHPWASSSSMAEKTPLSVSVSLVRWTQKGCLLAVVASMWKRER